MKKLILLLSIILSVISSRLFSQDLLSVLDSVENSKQQTEYTTGTFKALRLINGYTGETAGEKEFIFCISHRFNRLNSGVENFFGLDQSTIRFGFDYGVNDRLTLGIGRSSYQKLIDGYVKYKLFRQAEGANAFPVTVTIQESMAVRTMEWNNQQINYSFSSRLYYVHEVFVSRKFTDRLSMQIAPVLIHRNLVEKNDDQNTVAAVGFGGRYRITPRFSFTGEYYYLLPGPTADDYYNSLAFGVAIQAGGHVFQLNVSNSTGMTEKQFIPETLGSWEDGDIYFGFNIIRLFSFQ